MKLKYAAQIENVREVSLEGLADLDYWQQRLAAEGLIPASDGGFARVTVSGTEMRFIGVRFRELIVGVVVKGDRDAGLGEPVFLAEAYNSIRFFAWVERTSFSAPYRFGRIAVSLDPVSIWFGRNDSPILDAAIGEGRKPSQLISHDWNGVVHLPSLNGSSARKLFVAEISGETQVFPFEPQQDRFSSTPGSGDPQLRCLADSHFTGVQWQVRQAARHAKSKTYRRSDLATLLK